MQYKTSEYYQKISNLGYQYLPQIGVPDELLHLECKKIIHAMSCEGWSFYMLNAIRYLYRAGEETEDPTMDLYKAEHYLQWEIDRRNHNISWLPKFIQDTLNSLRIFDLSLVQARIHTERSRCLLGAKFTPKKPNDTI